MPGVQASKLYWGPERAQILRSLRFDNGVEVTVPGFLWPHEGEFPSPDKVTLTEVEWM